VNAKEQSMIAFPDNDNAPDEPIVFIIIGKAYRIKGDEGMEIHIMLAAPDDDTAVRTALDGMPDEEPHASAYQGVLEGEVAIIRFD
jgi:hypothetical protein